MRYKICEDAASLPLDTSRHDTPSHDNSSPHLAAHRPRAFQLRSIPTNPATYNQLVTAITDAEIASYNQTTPFPSHDSSSQIFTQSHGNEISSEERRIDNWPLDHSTPEQSGSGVLSDAKQSADEPSISKQYHQINCIPFENLNNFTKSGPEKFDDPGFSLFPLSRRCEIALSVCLLRLITFLFDRRKGTSLFLSFHILLSAVYTSSPLAMDPPKSQTQATQEKFQPIPHTIQTPEFSHDSPFDRGPKKFETSGDQSIEFEKATTRDRSKVGNLDIASESVPNKGLDPQGQPDDVIHKAHLRHSHHRHRLRHHRLRLHSRRRLAKQRKFGMLKERGAPSLRVRAAGPIIHDPSDPKPSNFGPSKGAKLDSTSNLGEISGVGGGRNIGATTSEAAPAGSDFGRFMNQVMERANNENLKHSPLVPTPSYGHPTSPSRHIPSKTTSNSQANRQFSSSLSGSQINTGEDGTRETISEKNSDKTTANSSKTSTQPDKLLSGATATAACRAHQLFVFHNRDNWLLRQQANDSNIDPNAHNFTIHIENRPKSDTKFAYSQCVSLLDIEPIQECKKSIEDRVKNFENIYIPMYEDSAGLPKSTSRQQFNSLYDTAQQPTNDTSQQQQQQQQQQQKQKNEQKPAPYMVMSQIRFADLFWYPHELEVGLNPDTNRTESVVRPGTSIDPDTGGRMQPIFLTQDIWDRCVESASGSPSCESCYTDFQQVIKSIVDDVARLFALFRDAFDCRWLKDDPSLSIFSVNSNCSYCESAYFQWVLIAQLFKPPVTMWDNNSAPDLRLFCKMADLFCPHLKTTNVSDYAGMPSFRCEDISVENEPIAVTQVYGERILLDGIIFHPCFIFPETAIYRSQYCCELARSVPAARLPSVQKHCNENYPLFSTPLPVREYSSEQYDDDSYLTHHQVVTSVSAAVTAEPTPPTLTSAAPPQTQPPFFRSHSKGNDDKTTSGETQSLNNNLGEKLTQNFEPVEQEDIAKSNAGAEYPNSLLRKVVSKRISCSMLPVILMWVHMVWLTVCTPVENEPL